MDRLLVLRLETSGVEAEGSLNGVPLLRVNVQRRVALLAVHEYALAGANRLLLTLRPPPPVGLAQPLAAELCDGSAWARLQLLLPRTGSVAHPDVARTVGQLEWAPAADTVLEFPAQLEGDVNLPIAFPRWRWLDMPLIAAPNATAVVADKPAPALEALRAPLAAWLREMALALARGDAAPLLQACRLRLEDQALAYQRPLADLSQSVAQQISTLHALRPLKPVLHTAATLVLRPVAGGRLLECLGADGAPALRAPSDAAVPDGDWVAWPLRVAQIDGRFYGVR
jgi:hypothetical protein